MIEKIQIIQNNLYKLRYVKVYLKIIIKNFKKKYIENHILHY